MIWDDPPLDWLAIRAANGGIPDTKIHGVPTTGFPQRVPKRKFTKFERTLLNGRERNQRVGTS